MKRHFPFITGDTPKQLLSHQHCYQYFDTAKLYLIYLMNGDMKQRFDCRMSFFTTCVVFTISSSNITQVNLMEMVDITIDRNLSFEKHISGVCSSCAMQTKALRHIHPFLNIQNTNAIACSEVFVSARLLHYSTVRHIQSQHSTTALSTK